MAFDEENQSTLSLMQDDPESHFQGIAFDEEPTIEFGKLEDGRRGERTLECLES